jgi:hypothetical protein
MDQQMGPTDTQVRTRAYILRFVKLRLGGSVFSVSIKLTRVYN